jgi:hypothetical protein
MASSLPLLSHTL